MTSSLKIVVLLLLVSCIQGQPDSDAKLKALYEKKIKAAESVSERYFPRRVMVTTYRDGESSPSYSTVSEKKNESSARYVTTRKELGQTRREEEIRIGDQYFERLDEQAWICAGIYPSDISVGSRLAYFTPVEDVRVSYEVMYVDSSRGSFTKLRKTTTNIRSGSIEAEDIVMVDEKGRIVERTLFREDGSFVDGIWKPFTERSSLKYEYDISLPEVVSPFPYDLQSCKRLQQLSSAAQAFAYPYLIELMRYELHEW